MEKIFGYFYGLWMALSGRYPFDELEHLEHIKVQIKDDARWLASVPQVNILAQRHDDLVSDEWRSKIISDSGRFRRKLTKSLLH